MMDDQVVPITIVITCLVVVYLMTSATFIYTDSLCSNTIGENVSAAENATTIADGQLDCRYPNGTVVRDVEPRPMNLSNASPGSLGLYPRTRKFMVLEPGSVLKESFDRWLSTQIPKFVRPSG